MPPPLSPSVLARCFLVMAACMASISSDTTGSPSMYSLVSASRRGVSSAPVAHGTISRLQGIALQRMRIEAFTVNQNTIRGTVA
jgi:hypothetical protein